MYKKPPKEYQFKKGQSGNPKGRPKDPDIRMIELTAEFMQLLLKTKSKDKPSLEKLHKIRKIMSE